MDYYTIGAGKKGKRAISSFVFTQIAEEAVLSLIENELKDQVVLVSTKKGSRITTRVDSRNKATIDIEVNLYDGVDADKCYSIIQKGVIDAIVDQLEVSCKVNVKVLKILKKA